MTPSESLALKIWSVVYLVGFASVWLGVVLEGFEIIERRWRARRSTLQAPTEPWFVPSAEHSPSKWVHLAGDWGWLILVIGLGLEELAHHKIDGIKSDEILRLTRKLESTTQLAGDAIERAGLANERSAFLSRSNLLLQETILLLQKEMAPRRITIEQATNFMFLTEQIEKIPIKIIIHQGDGETTTFACDIREMFRRSGFVTNADASSFGLNFEPQLLYARFFLATNVFQGVTFAQYTTNRVYAKPQLVWQRTNGVDRPVVQGTNSLQVFEGLRQCFEKIGIATEWIGIDLAIKPGEYAIIIRSK